MKQETVGLVLEEKDDSYFTVFFGKEEFIRSERQIRNDIGLTQAQLAKRMGTTQANISLFERGVYNPTLSYLKKMASALGKELVIEFK